MDRSNIPIFFSDSTFYLILLKSFFKYLYILSKSFICAFTALAFTRMEFKSYFQCTYCFERYSWDYSLCIDGFPSLLQLFVLFDISAENFYSCVLLVISCSYTFLWFEYWGWMGDVVSVLVVLSDFSLKLFESLMTKKRCNVAMVLYRHWYLASSNEGMHSRNKAAKRMERSKSPNLGVYTRVKFPHFCKNSFIWFFICAFPKYLHENQLFLCWNKKINFIYTYVERKVLLQVKVLFLK